MKRLGKIILWLLFAFVAAFLAAGGAAVAFLANPKALPSLVAGVERLVPGFTVRQVSGRFFSSWSLAGISYRRGDFAVAIDNLRLRWRGRELPHGLIAIDELAVSGIRLELPPSSSPAEEKTADKSQVPLFIPSWLRLCLNKLDISDTRLSSGGREVLTLDNLRGSGEISTGTVRVKGLRLAGKAAAGRAESIRFAASADGTATGIAQPDAAIALDSRIDLWPGRGFSPMAGVLTAHGTLAKPEFALHLTAPVPVTLSAQAEHEKEHWRWRGELSGERIGLQAINARWRPAQISVRAKATGLDARYEATATGTVMVPGKGESHVALALTGGTRNLALEECRLGGAFGLLKAKGAFTWAEGFSWQGAIEADGFDPAFFAPDYAGALNAALTTSGAITDHSRIGSLTIEKLSGQMRGYPVTGSGGLHFAGDRLTIDSLSLASGKARLNLAGDIAGQVNLTADITVPDLGEVLTQTAGRLEARAAVDGTMARPRIEAEIKGRDLAFGGRQLALLTTSFTGTWGTEKPEDKTFSGQLNAERLSENNRPLLNFLKLSLDGSLARHQVALSVRAPLGEAAIRLFGGIKEKSWDGAVDSLALDSAAVGRWRQNGAARLTLSADKGELTAVNLASGEGGGRLTAGFTGEGAARLWQVAINDGRLPLSLLPVVDGKKASGLVTFTVDAEGKGALLARGRLSVHTSQADLPGIAVLPGFRRFRLDETGLDATINGGMLALGAKSHFNGENDLALNLTLTAPDAAFDLTDVSALSQAPLAGSLRLSMADINFVGPVSHYTTMPSGAVLGDFAVQGTPLYPRLVGKVTMPNGGHVEITSSGIDIKDVEIGADIGADLAGADGLVLNLTVNGTSGPGHATAVGVLKFPWTAPFSGDFSATGSNCDVFRRPEYHIRANPDVRMFFDRVHGRLTGNVDVTWAEIAPENIEGSVWGSDDLIIADEKEDPGWRFLTDLHIHLGDEVHFSGYGLTGLLRGDLTVQTDATGRFIGRGALQLADGAFIIYGRRLQVERGRLSFAGGAIDDPLIDARAQKLVLTSGAGVHEILVGVDVSGSAHEPEFELFSSEPLGDREILTYIMSGTSASKDAPDATLLASAAKALGLDDRANLLGGMGLLDEVSLERNENDNSMSLLVGKRLTDDLFIGYDQNFVGESGAFKIRYNLGRGFTVETSSSGSSSSADLFYSFEK